MAAPRFPAVDRDGKIQEAHLPPRLSESALVSLIQREAPGGGGDATPVADTGLDALATKIGFGGAGQHTMAVVGDSTMSGLNGSLRIWDLLYSQHLPDTVRHVFHDWVPENSAWEHFVNEEGDVTPAHDGLVLHDTFSRVASDLVGSTPDVGDVWAGTAGGWTADGSVARPTGYGPALATDARSKNVKVTTTLQIVTEAFGLQTYRIYVGSPGAATLGLWVAINISSYGELTITPFFAHSGGSDRIGDELRGSQVGLVSGQTAPQSVTLTMEIDIQNVTITLTGPAGTVSTTGQITVDQYDQLGTWTNYRTMTADTPGLALDEVRIETPPQPASGAMLDVWNGAISGGRFSTFNEAKLVEIFDSIHTDILLVSMGHNHGTQSAASFATEVQAWVGLWMTLHPETQSIIWVSQNPQYPPATAISYHRDRQLAMRALAKQKCWGYVAGFEAFATQPDGGQSIMRSDGIHPTNPPAPGITTGDYGAVFMAETILGAIRARV